MSVQKKNDFDYFQTKDNIDKLGCILNNKVYHMIIWNKIFEKLNLKQFESPKITPQYIKVYSNGTFTLSNKTETSLFCSCDIQHDNLNEEKQFYVSSIKKNNNVFPKKYKNFACRDSPNKKRNA